MHTWASSFGITAAFLIIGSYTLLRWQRSRHEFELAKLALERGGEIARTNSKSWLDGLRRAIGTLGIGLVIVTTAGFVWFDARTVPLPDKAELLTWYASNSTSADGHRRPPHPPNKEAWDRAQERLNFAICGASIGGSLVILGLVGISFAVAEQRLSYDS